MKEKQIIVVSGDVDVIRAFAFDPVPRPENSIIWDLRLRHLNELMLIPKSWSFWKKFKYIWKGE